MGKTNIGMLFIAALLVAAWFPPPVAVAANREIRPGAGLATFHVSASEGLDLYVNTRPKSNDTPLHEWILVAASNRNEIFLLTPEGILPIVPEIDFCSHLFPFSHDSETELVASARMNDLGLHAGDTLIYGYVYTVSDVSQAVLANLTVIEVTAPENGLRTYSSPAELESSLKKGLRRISEPGKFTYIPAPDILVTVNGAGSEVAGRSLFSSTNLQEAGVDEADVVKTDGKYLYIAPRQDTVQRVFFDAVPASLTKSASGSAIRVMEMAENPPSATEVAQIALGDKSAEALYLVTGRGGEQKDLLVAVSGNKSDMWGCWSAPWNWTQGKTGVLLFDVSDPASPRQIAGLELDGHLISSRRIGDTLYLVTRFTPMPEGFRPYAWDAEELSQNEIILDNTTLSDLLPGFSINGEVKKALVLPETCFVPQRDEEPAEQPTLITIAAVPLSAPGNLVSQTISGPTETIYVSPQTLYLATVRYNDDPYPVAASVRYPEHTDLHKFVLAETGPVYKASGTVPGYLGWEQEKKPFRMSEYRDVLRIATSLGYTWDGSSTTRLTLLQENGSELREISHLDGIGKKGEELYAVRFAAQNAYVVTFRVTDPLYVFDLSDPEQPKELGALHIDGYSDYLHPIGNNLLLGIGKDAIPDTFGDFEGRGAWYQGVKLALFDISDPTAPQEVNSIVLGKRGTHSEALNDHHAVTYLPPVDGKPARLAIPVELHEERGNDSSYDTPSTPWHYYGWTHTGLYLFNVFTGGQEEGRTAIELQGKLIVEEKGDSSNPPYDGDYGTFRDRSILLGDSVHYIHDSQVWSAVWESSGVLAEPQ